MSDDDLPPVSPTAPLRLADAIRIAFPAGGINPAGLRREAARGRLVIERIAGKDFTTLAAIEDMRRLCRVEPERRVLRQRRPEDDGGAALAGLLASADRLKQRLSTERAQARQPAGDAEARLSMAAARASVQRLRDREDEKREQKRLEREAERAAALAAKKARKPVVKG